MEEGKKNPSDCPLLNLSRPQVLLLTQNNPSAHHSKKFHSYQLTWQKIPLTLYVASWNTKYSQVMLCFSTHSSSQTTNRQCRDGATTCTRVFHSSDQVSWEHQSLSPTVSTNRFTFLSNETYSFLQRDNDMLHDLLNASKQSCHRFKSFACNPVAVSVIDSYALKAEVQSIFLSSGHLQWPEWYFPLQREWQALSVRSME